MNKLLVTLSVLLVSALLLGACTDTGGSRKSAYTTSGLSNGGCQEGQTLQTIDGTPTCVDNEDGGCQLNSDCDAGYTCQYHSTGNTCELISTQDACQNHANCQNDEFCNLSLSPKECEARKAYGTACNAPYSTYCSNYCDSGSFYQDGTTKKCGCQAADCTGVDPICSALRNRCVQTRTSGQSCNTTNLECASGLTCNGGVCGTGCNGICCTTYANCSHDSYCDNTGHCVVGCQTSVNCTNGKYCALGGVCTPKCTAPGITGPLGAFPCTNSTQYCNVGTGVCEAKLGYGDTIPNNVAAADACQTGQAYKQRVNMVDVNKCGCGTDGYCQGLGHSGGCSITNHVCIDKDGVVGAQCGDVNTSQGNCSATFNQTTQVGCDDCTKKCTTGKWYQDGQKFYCGCTAIAQCPSGTGLCTPSNGLEPYRCIAKKAMDAPCLLAAECSIGVCDTADHLCGIAYDHTSCSNQSQCSTRGGNNDYCDIPSDFNQYGCGWSKCCGKKPNGYHCDHGYQCQSGSCPSTKCKS
ncbi:MAG: hypothetical protein WCQ53_04895 [bacterium]